MVLRYRKLGHWPRSSKYTPHRLVFGRRGNVNKLTPNFAGWTGVLDLRFSERYWWIFQSTGTWRRVGWHTGTNTSAWCLHVDGSFFVHFVVCRTRGLQPLPKRVLPRVRLSTSTFNFHQPRFYFRSSSSFLRLLLLLPVTSILPSIFSSILCFRRQFLHKMWQIKVVCLLFIVSRISSPHRLFVILLMIGLG
jgi:hypothetical protein